MRTWYGKYHDYLESPQWKIIRAGALDRSGNHCQLCTSTRKLNVHHNTYENLGNERDEDLVVLCRRCHIVFHARRDKRTSKMMLKRFANVPDSVGVFPAPPIDAMPESGESSSAASKSPSVDANGIMKQFMIDKAYINLLVSPFGGITYRGLRMLGEVPPWKQGWRLRSAGRIVEVDEGELTAERADVAAKHAGTYVKRTKSGKIKENRVEITESQMREVYSDYMHLHGHSVGYGPIMKKWNCERYVVKKIVRRGMDENWSNL